MLEKSLINMHDIKNFVDVESENCFFKEIFNLIGNEEMNTSIEMILNSPVLSYNDLEKVTTKFCNVQKALKDKSKLFDADTYTTLVDSVNSIVVLLNTRLSSAEAKAKFEFLETLATIIH